MAKTLKDLLLALLNATLILVALCLFLGWKLAQSVENVQTGFAEQVQQVAPLRDQAQAIRAELAGLRSDLADLRAQGGTLDQAARANLNEALTRLSTVEEKLSATQARLSGLVDNPEDLIDYAITTASEAVTDQLQDLRGCRPTG